MDECERQTQFIILDTNWLTLASNSDPDFSGAKDDIEGATSF
ncbi:hypothetical protein GGD67_002949 [Bradyrhizobium sp. IAR9]|nr:hypothetical protein [Bradyrhizobium sp. IAR9]